jgi:hypothetical protein
MRSPIKSALIIQILAAVQLGAAANLLAAEDYAHLSQGMSDQKQWVCDYTRAANDVLYLRCEDRLSLLQDPLIMEDSEGSDIQYIPIWRKPNDDRSAIRLIESVLCNQVGDCSVEMKSMSRTNRYANR